MELRLGDRVYRHEFLVTPLDVEFSGVFGMDLLRVMEAKLDLCSSGLIIGRRLYELTGLDFQNRDVSQVTDMIPVVSIGRGLTGMINPKVPARNELTTRKYIGAGKPESLVRGEPNPDSPAIHSRTCNTCCIMASALAILPPRSRAVVMGRMVRNKSSKLPRQIIVEPAQVGNPEYI